MTAKNYQLPEAGLPETVNAGAVGRRTFMRTGAAGLVGAALANSLPQRAGAEQTEAKTPLVLVRCENATDDAGVGKPSLVRDMVHRAVRELSGKDSVADAWREFVSPNDIVGLKVNVRGGKHLSTQLCTVDAIVEGLKAAGVKENNILVWDAWNKEFPHAGYTLNESSAGVRCYGVDRGVADRRRRGDGAQIRQALKQHFDTEPVTLGGKPVWLAKILTEEITALVNVPIIKDHNYAGVTLSMKNHYGCILNPSDLHDDHCDPYIAELNLLPVIKDKTRLILLDALRGIYDGGPHLRPGGRFRHNTIIAGTDTVAVDALGLRIIEEKRKEAGLQPIVDSAKHIATAAKLGLGTNDFAKIDLKEIELSSENKA